MKEALVHLHTNIAMKTLRCGPMNSRDAKRGTGPKGYTEFGETFGETQRHSSDQNWKELLLQTLNQKTEIFVDDSGASMQHAQ